MHKLLSHIKTNKIIYLLSISIIVLIIFLFVQKKTMQQEMDLKVQFIEQKNMLRNQLDDIVDEHEDLLNEYGELNQDLQQKDSVIRQQVLEINSLREEIVEACRFLPDKEKHLYLLDAPESDKDGNPYVIRYNRTEDTHYVASEKDGKKTKWTATYSNGQWVENLKS